MLWETMGGVWDQLELDMNEREGEWNCKLKRGTTQSLSVTVVGCIVLYWIIYGRGERERGRNRKWMEKVVFLYFVCVCIKNGKGRVRGMLGLGQRDGVAYKRITPNIRQNKQTYFVFTSFYLCFLFFFSCFACCFCCCFSCTTSFWHFPTLGKETPLSLSLWLCEKQMGKKVPPALSLTTRAL